MPMPLREFSRRHVVGLAVAGLALAVCKWAADEETTGVPRDGSENAGRTRRDRAHSARASERASTLHMGERTLGGWQNGLRNAISGRVESEQGIAIVNARVCAVDPSAACCSSAACVLSDAGGAFVLDV